MGYYDKQTETASRELLQAIQWRKLRALLEVTFARNEFYRRKFASHGVGLPDIRDLSDLHRLPYTTKTEFQQDQELHPPFGTNLSEPLSNYVQFHQTTGTTGRPLKRLDTAESWQWLARCMAHAFRGADLGPGDVFMLPFNFGPYTAFWGAYEAAQHLGILTIPTGGWDTKQRLQCLLENGVTALATTPTYAQRMAETAQEEGIDLRESEVRAIILAGEPGALVPAIRDKIQSAWGAKVYDYSGMTEVGPYAVTCEESERTLATHALESEFIVEVIDPETGKAVPEGTPGELVVTNLGRTCSPSIRFRTSDLVNLTRDSCACGRTFALLKGGVLGRCDDMILVRGVNVFPSAVSNLMERVLPPGHEYQIVRYRSPEGTYDLKVRVEVAHGQEHLTQLVSRELKDRLNLRIDIEPVAVGTLPRFDYKANRITEVERGH